MFVGLSVNQVFGRVGHVVNKRHVRLHLLLCAVVFTNILFRITCEFHPQSGATQQVFGERKKLLQSRNIKVRSDDVK